MTDPTLRLVGAREHTLTGFDLELPHNAWIAVVGPSGSGKSSLAYDTIFREGQRRYLSSLSARARQRLGKLGRPAIDAMSGVRPALAVGQRSVSANPRSTLGTRSGILPVLRLLFARAATFTTGEVLTRSHFSFNHPLGACPDCDGLGVADQVEPELLIRDPTRSLRDGALVPTLKSGYTVYSQVTVEVMDQICRAHGFDVDTPWQDLTEAQQRVILYGTDRLKVTFGKHSLESRLKWSGITARPRSEGYYRGLVPVIEATLERDRNPNVLRFVRSVRCPTCAGTRLGEVGRTATMGSTTLPALLAMPIRDLRHSLDALPPHPALDALGDEILRRVDGLTDVGLGYLGLDRGTVSLSGGESQRLRLAALVSTRLGGQTLVFDEPTLGLHPSEQPGLARTLRRLQALGNTVIVVEHDPSLVQQADVLVELGPGAGPHGGELLYAGPNRPQALGARPEPRSENRASQGTFLLEGATRHNLDAVDWELPLGVLTVVAGPSGAGKSTLVLDCLVPALEASAHPVQALDARPIGRTPRSTPATYTGLMDGLRKRFAATDAARARGWKAGRFSYNNKQGRCPVCEGLGVQRVGLHLVADAEQICSVCAGSRFNPETLEVRWRERTIGQWLDLDVDTALAALSDDAGLAPMLTALQGLGLGYLTLGQSSSTLSGGEAQRIRLATVLGTTHRSPAVIVLDEPDRGLHPSDVGRLVDCLHALVDQGHTVVAISHHPQLWAQADHLVELQDGRIFAEDPPRKLVGRDTPTGRAMAGVDRREGRPIQPVTGPLRLRGVRTHNLDNLDLDLPRGCLIGVVGVSGSGKSSLVFDTVAAEAWSRVAEGLPFEVRRHLRQLPPPDLDEADGLTPVVALTSDQPRPGQRSTVATLTGLGPDLRLLWSRAATDGAPSAAHFSPDHPLGACPACDGLGMQQRLDPDRLITHPDRPLHDGAMAGTRPGRYFGEADGQFMATWRAAAHARGLDVTAAWRDLSTEARRLALDGAGDEVLDVTWRFKRGTRTGEHHLQTPWVGLSDLVEAEARTKAGTKRAAEFAAPLRPVPCPACAGSGLQEIARKARFHGLTLPDLWSRTVTNAAAWLGTQPPHPILDGLRPRVLQGLDDLAALGLGHLSLARRIPTLSDGEVQRVRLATQLREGLSGILYALDEPGRGLHDDDLPALADRLRALRDAGNTVLMVTHRAALIRDCDHLVELGPGAGDEGGRIVAEGPTEQVLAGDTATAVALRTDAPPTPSTVALDGPRIVGASARSLTGFDLSLPAAGLVAITGVSGAGKSTLLFEVIGASAAEGRPVGCREAHGLDRYTDVVLARAAAVSPHQSLASHLGLFPAFQRHFAASGDLPRRAFSARSPTGSCPGCKGTGVERVSMDVLADLSLPCPVCDGQRYRPEVLAVRWNGRNLAEWLATNMSAVRRSVADAPILARVMDALAEVGLADLALGRTLGSLSAGERQRVSLARRLADRGPGRTLFLLDEPDAGLHAVDVDRLLRVCRALAERGDLVVAITHRQRLARAADYSVRLGPGAGRAGGALV